MRNLLAISLLVSEAGPFISNDVHVQDLLKRSNLQGPVSRWQLLVPKDREIDPLGQGFGGELRGLMTRGDRLDELRGQKRKPQQSSHVTGSDAFALCDVGN